MENKISNSFSFGFKMLQNLSKKVTLKYKQAAFYRLDGHNMIA